MQYNIIYREKDRSWQYIISYKDSSGKWRQKSKQGFPLDKKGKQAAKDAALEALDELKKKINLKTSYEFSEITFEKFGKYYLEHSKLYSSPKTVESTQTVLNKFSDLNDMKLCEITTLDIQKIIDDFTKEKLSPNTIRYYLKKLSIILGNAKYQYNIICDIPTKNIKVSKPKEVAKSALNEDEIKNLLLKFSNSKYYLLVYLSANTGMRIGEVLGLTWKDIDLKNNTIDINKQWKKLSNGEYGFGDLKSKNSKRIIPISKKVSKELLKHKNVINMDTRVFNFKNKASTITVVNRLLKNYGYNISIHELRHTYATKLIASGLDFKTAASLLGHDVQQTIRTYSHVNDDMLTKAKNLIENIF